MKVAIIGTAPASRAMAPFADQSWKIWACSPGNKGVLPRVDLWFELHSLVDMVSEEYRGWSLDYFGWLRAQSFPVYMQEKNEYVPQALVYPLRDMIRLFGRNWFSSSIAYMMAMAISQMRAGDTIGIFGVDMAAAEEHYTGQKSGLVRFTEIARERGIIVESPFESCLAKCPPMYGYSEATHFGRHLNVRKRTIVRTLADMRAQKEKLDKEICYFEGALEQINYDIRTWADGEDFEALEGGPAPAAPKATEAPPDFSKFEPTGDSALLMPKAAVAEKTPRAKAAQQQ